MPMDYDFAVKYIYNIPKFTKKGGIEQTRALMAMLGNPQRTFKYIHVAGTNGKGSVCALMEKGLRKCGIKTGLFTSPHLVHINERICVDGCMISDEDFLTLFLYIKDKVDAYIKQGGVHPTFFEWMYMMAMQWFKIKGVRWAVVETGLGGRLDATNVIEKPEVTVITAIGYDHMQYLGRRLADIAGEKAGIIKKGVPLIYDASVPEVCPVIEERFRQVQGSLKAFGPGLVAAKPELAQNIEYTKDHIHYDTIVEGSAVHVVLSMLGTYQINNSLTAFRALSELGRANDYFRLSREIFYENILAAFKETSWPGRMERVNDHLYVDGAHNDDGIRALVQTIRTRFAGQNIYLLFAVAEDKDYEKMIKVLCGLEKLSGIVVTVIDNVRKVDAEKIADLFEKNGHAPVKWTYNIEEALRTAVKWTGEDILCCCGSLYLAGSIKEILG